MATFDNLMAAFLGKENSSNSDTPLPPDAFGEYVLTTFQYRDDNADVSMDIGRLIKVNDYETSDDSLSLKNIHISEQNQEVTFAFYSNSEKVLLKTDVPSMENFVAQKTIESYVYLEPTFSEIPQYTANTLPVWNIKETVSAWTRQTISTILDFLPLAGSSKTITELIYGYDPITNQEISRISSGFALAYSILPGGKVIGRTANRILAEAPDILKRFSPNYQTIKSFVQDGYQGASKYFVLSNDRLMHAGDIIKQLKPEVQQTLKTMRIPDKPLVPGGGLLAHELRDGHAIEKHVGKAVDSLIERRLAEAPRSFGRPRHYSTFNNLEEAEYFVAETIERNKNVINQWLPTAKRPTKFELSFEKPTGKFLKEGELSLVDVQGVRIILLPSKETSCGYKLVTAFPIE